jgi:hypothetical protein
VGGPGQVSTFLRLFASLFFILLIFLVNEGIKARYARRVVGILHPKPGILLYPKP